VKKILAMSIAAVLSLVLLSAYSRWTTFIPYAWVSLAGPWVWGATSALILVLFAVRLARANGASSLVDKRLVVVVAFAALMGFMLREVFTGAAALVNSTSPRQVEICVQLEALHANPRGLFERTQDALVKVPGDGNEVARKLRYMPSALYVGDLAPGAAVVLSARRGVFGYTVEGRISALTEACAPAFPIEER